MDLIHAIDPFVSDFYCYRGFFFKAQPLAVPLEESSTYFFLPRRILKAYPNTQLRPGDIISQRDTMKEYLVAENGPSLFNGVIIHRTFKLFEVTDFATPWVHKIVGTDGVTGLPKKSSTVDTTITAVIEFTKTQEDEMRIGADLVRIITKDQVSVGDKIKDYTVINTEPQLGLYFSTARRM